VGDDFSIEVSHGSTATVIRCRGSLDLLPAEKLREAAGAELETDARSIVLDCSEVSLLTSAGITALVDVAIGCREARAELDMIFSPHCRRVLDLVGLWWLGVVDDGIAVHASLQSALRSYADQSFEGKIPEASEADD
jgi:anti-anti-sigma factor